MRWLVTGRSAARQNRPKGHAVEPAALEQGAHLGRLDAPGQLGRRPVDHERDRAALEPVDALEHLPEGVGGDHHRLRLERPDHPHLVVERLRHLAQVPNRTAVLRLN